MTDDNLREACERVAKRWLGWEFRAFQDTEVLHKRFESKWIRVSTDHNILIEREDIGDMLASPWGMDLLLDAVEKRRVTLKYESFIAADNKGVVHECHIFAPPSSYDDGERQIGFGDDTNRYAALIFALDTVEVLDENS